MMNCFRCNFGMDAAIMAFAAMDAAIMADDAAFAAMDKICGTRGSTDSSRAVPTATFHRQSIAPAF
jgi:hypothetical protein